METPSERDISLPSGRLHARGHGPSGGPLAIGIPGLSANVIGFDALGPRLAADGRRLVAMDLRGRGRSDVTPPGTYGLDAHARDVVAAADALAGDAPFDVIGWSMGALVAMHVAALAHERVRSVVLVDHAGRVDDTALDAVRRGLDRLDAVVPSPEPYLEAIRAAGAATPWDDLWERYYTYELGPAEGGGLTPTTSKAACLEDLDGGVDIDAHRLWGGLTMPTLLVRANAPLAGGFVVPEDERDALAAAVPGLRVFESERNHFGVMTDPGAIEAMAELLAAAA
jgi:pimeloyl-ACP methyl ester carboxylesterase